MRKLAVSSRWESIRNVFGLGSRTTRKGVKTQRRRKFSFESLEERSLLSVCHWTGAADNTWSNPQNWDNAPQAGDDLVFQGTGIATQNDLPDKTTFDSITFASSGFTLTGNSVWVSGNITVDSGVASATISLNVALGGAATVDVTDASSSLTVPAVLSAGGSLTKTGDGTLILSGANTYTGGTMIDDGTLVLGDDDALGAAAGSIYVNGGNASLNLNGHSPEVGAVVLTNGSIVTGSGAATLTAGSYTVMNGTVSANLAGYGGLTKITNDLVTLTGTNTYSGLTTVSAGELQMTGANAWNTVFNEGGADIQGGKLVFDYTNGSSPASTVLSILTASYGDGSNPFSVDNGAAIYSSTAEDAGKALGWADDGVGNVTVMYTLYGDADLNGAVNVSDLGRVLSNFGSTTATWANGDFDYDHVVTGSDLGRVLSNFGSTLPQPSLVVSGADRVDQGSTYTLTLGQVVGVTAQSYTIDWGDGTSPDVYTAAQIDALNRQVTHTYDNGFSSPIITVALTDSQGGVYYAAAGKSVAVTTAAPISAAPVIHNFLCINDAGDMWTFTGTVTDADDPVQGDVVVFGTIMAITNSTPPDGWKLTTTVGADGTFSLTVELDDLQTGTVTAQTSDPHGVLSNLACDWIVV